jgi:hypothetical protein
MEHERPCPEPDKSSPYHPRSILIVSSYLRLRLPIGLFFLSFHTFTMYALPVASCVLYALSIISSLAWSFWVKSGEGLHKTKQDIQAIHDPIVPADIVLFINVDRIKWRYRDIFLGLLFRTVSAVRDY